MKTVPPPPDNVLLELVSLTQAVNARLNQYYQHWQQSAQLEIMHKADESPLTEADLAAHQMIEQGLAQLTPAYPVLSEESSEFEQRHQWTHFWLVDPLDGTREFVKKTGEFTVNIALIEHGVVKIALIGVPTQQRIYIGRQGQAVYRVDTQTADHQWHEIEPMAVSADQWRVAMTRRSDRPAYAQFRQYLTDIKQNFVQLNAGSAYKFCLMLEGEVDVYPRLHPTSEWDTASGQGLLEMLGGGLYDLRGRPFVYNQRARLLNNEFVAVRHTRYLHTALAAAVQAMQQHQP